MKVIWVLDEPFEAESMMIQRALTRADITFITDTYDVHKTFGRIRKALRPYWDGEFGEDICVIPYGSLEFVRAVSKEFYTMDWYDHDAFKCSSYYSLLGNHLLNFKDRIYLPFSEIDKSYNRISSAFPGTSVFIRSDVGSKTMPAMVHNIMSEKLFLDSWDGVKQIYTGNDESMCVLSTDVTDRITHEWRFFVVGGKVVTGSRYMDHGQVRLRKLKMHMELGDGDNDMFDCAIDKLAMTYAQERADELVKRFPVSSYTLDVCRMASYDLFKVVELNALNCSGVYECDLDVFVTTVSDQAVKELDE